MQRLILGAPGCGKTTRLLSIIEEELSGGVKPRQIGFISFTRKAIHEAVERTSLKFGLSPKDDLPFFRTLHSLAFRQLGIQLTEIMGRNDYAELGKVLHLEFGGIDYETGIFSGARSGDIYAQLEQESRLRKVDIWSLPKAKLQENFFKLKMYVETLKNYKQAMNTMDFTDVILKYSQEGDLPAIKVLIVDEAQDLNPIQWDIVKRLSSVAERVYIAGDDDQAIFTWAGADVSHFLALKGEQEVLPISYRLPQSVFDVANGITKTIKNRFPKVWSPREEKGSVSWLPDIEYMDVNPEESYLFLARHNYHLEDAVHFVRGKGLPYISKGKPSVHQEDADAVIAWMELQKTGAVKIRSAKAIVKFLKKELRCNFVDNQPGYMVKDILKKPEYIQLPWHEVFQFKDMTYYKRLGDITVKPQILISTIHSVKGGEADNVYLMTDMSRQAFDDYETSRDDEARVFYVGVTRARKNLIMQHPKTRKYFPIRT